MRISKKNKKRILEKISEIFFRHREYNFPGEFDSAPDTWYEEQRKIFDIYSELEAEIFSEIEKILDS